MKSAPHLAHEFVTIIPDELKENTLYVSMEYATIVHLCCCGCGREVVTPLSPTDWALTYDGISVSLSPSIGNWSFECKSHYWIFKSEVRWARRWSRERIEVGREYDRTLKGNYYIERDVAPGPAANFLGKNRVKDLWKALKQMSRKWVNCFDSRRQP